MRSAVGEATGPAVADATWDLRRTRSPRPADGICLDAAEATGPAVADVTAALLGSLLELSRTSLA